MKYSKLELYISQPRLNRFLRASANSKTKTKKLYRINLRACQSFYPILNIFEIFFRNAIYNAVATEFGNIDWILSEKNGFMLDARLRNMDIRHDVYLKKQVEKAEKKLRREGCTITSTKLIAEQTLGFWTAFFDHKHYPVTRGSALKAFQNKPVTANRKTVEQKLGRIRDIRNRIYHNEPICFKGSAIDFSDAKQALSDIHDLLNWIDPQLNIYANYYNKILATIKQAEIL